jgi:hypothetical protein
VAAGFVVGFPYTLAGGRAFTLKNLSPGYLLLFSNRKSELASFLPMLTRVRWINDNASGGPCIPHEETELYLQRVPAL